MTEDSRKRRLLSIRESDQVDCPAKQRKVDITLMNGCEGRVQRVTRQLKDFFFWLADLPSKNYFIESTMSAMHLRSSSLTKNKSKIDTRDPREERPEESSVSPLKKIRYRNLKRPPVRECFNETKNFMSILPLPLPSCMDGKILSSDAKRNVPAIKHPFKSSRSFQRISCHESSKHSAKKREELENGNAHCHFTPSHPTGSYSTKKDRDIRVYTGSGKSSHSTLIFQTRAPAADIQGHKESSKHSAKKREELTNGNAHCHFSPTHPIGSYSTKKDRDIRIHTRSGKSSHGSLTFQTRAPAADIQVHKESIYRKNVSTPQEILELQEKDQYKVLLEQYIGASDHGIFPTMKPSFVRLDAAQTSTHPAFTKKKLDKDDLRVFLEKYVKISPKDSASTNKNSLSTVESPPIQNAATEDDVIITDVKMLPPRPVPPSMIQTSKFFAPEWIDELRKSFDNETSIRGKMVEKQMKKIQEYKRQRAAKITEDEARNQNQYRLSGTVLPETVETEIDFTVEIPELTEEMDEKIDEALKLGPPEEVLCEGFNVQVTRKDIETLSKLNWLNDEIIYFYISLLMERSKEENYPSVYAFNTFFYPKLLNGGHGALKRWTRKIDIFSYDLILVPVHMGMHWCLAVIDFRCKKIQYYDSMGGQNFECLHALRDYLKDEHLDKKKVEFDMSFWIFENVKNIPHQMNGSDCGMFALKYAEYITRDAKINFTQEHMRYFRRRMVYEILTKKLL